MFEILHKGFIIGILASAPVGPIAVLCIQRTIQKGRIHGFVSGLGAATSDLLYAMVALYGLSFVTDFIHNHQFIIQIIGSIVVAIFGFYIFFSNPVKSLNRHSEKKENYRQEYLTSFLLTLSNPMMIFLFLGLFARFNFMADTNSVWMAFPASLAVFIGALSWWFTLTLFASYFRKQFNIRGLLILNRITGSLIIVLAFVALTLTISGSTLSLS